MKNKLYWNQKIPTDYLISILKGKPCSTEEEVKWIKKTISELLEKGKETKVQDIFFLIPEHILQTRIKVMNEISKSNKLKRNLNKARGEWKQWKLSYDEVISLIPEWLDIISIENVNYLLQFCKWKNEIDLIIYKFCNKENKPNHITMKIVRKYGARYTTHIILIYEIRITNQWELPNRKIISIFDLNLALCQCDNLEDANNLIDIFQKQWWFLNNQTRNCIRFIWEKSWDTAWLRFSEMLFDA